MPHKTSRRVGTAVPCPTYTEEIVSNAVHGQTLTIFRLIGRTINVVDIEIDGVVLNNDLLRIQSHGFQNATETGYVFVFNTTVLAIVRRHYREFDAASIFIPSNSRFSDIDELGCHIVKSPFSHGLDVRARLAVHPGIRRSGTGRNPRPHHSPPCLTASDRL